MKTIHIMYGAEDGIHTLRGGVGTVAQNFITAFNQLRSPYRLKLSVFTIMPPENSPGRCREFAKNVKKICAATGGQLISIPSERSSEAPYFNYHRWEKYNQRLRRELISIIDDEEFTLIVSNDSILAHVYYTSKTAATIWIPHSLAAAHAQSYVDNKKRTVWEAKAIEAVNHSSHRYIGYLSAYARQLLKNVDRTKLIYTPNGFNPSFLNRYCRSQRKIVRYLRRRGVPTGKPLVVSFGRADEYKGLDESFKRMVPYTKRGYAGILIASRFSNEEIVQKVQDGIRELARHSRGIPIKLFFGYEFILPKYLMQYRLTKVLLHLPVRDFCPLIPLEAHLLNQRLKVINSNISCNADFIRRKKCANIAVNYTRIICEVMAKLHEKSAGAVVVQDGKVLVIKRRDGLYGLPKGHIKRGETERQAAHRETFEETGLQVTLDKRLGTVSRENKDIVFFRATVTGGTRKHRAQFVPIPIAIRRLKHPRDAEFLMQQEVAQWKEKKDS